MSNQNITLAKGFQLGDYKIIKKISSGGFSIVYLGHTSEGSPVAIKEFFPSSLHLRTKGSAIDFINMREKHKFNEGLKAFRLEMELVTRLKHRNIIEITNYFETNGTAYIVMPYEYGMTLSKYISSNLDISESDILYISKGVFSAINMLHENNIIHLDLKPGNIWIRPNKDALILDFGTARDTDDEEKKKTPPMFTPGYAAPEQHKQYFKPEHIGFWTDLYGLGTTMYALIEKTAPLPADELMKQNIKKNLFDYYYGKYSKETLEIISELMQLEIKKRKQIDLNAIIKKIDKIKPIPYEGPMVDDLNF